MSPGCEGCLGPELLALALFALVPLDRALAVPRELADGAPVDPEPADGATGREVVPLELVPFGRRADDMVVPVSEYLNQFRQLLEMQRLAIDLLASLRRPLLRLGSTVGLGS